MKRTPYTPKDFTWTKWSAQDIKNLVPRIITEKKTRIAAIKKTLLTDINFENAVYALEVSDYSITDTILKIDLLQNVSPDKAIREAATRAIQIIQKRMIDIERDPKIWRILKTYEQDAWRDERAHLTPEERKLFRDMFITYKRMGFELDPVKQRRIKTLEQRLAKISNTFRQNINKYSDHITVTESEASGLPDRYKKKLKKDKQDRYIVTLAYPDYHPFMELAENEAKRKELAEKYLQKGGQKNMEVLAEMLNIRAEHARLLGYKTHADYKTEIRMAKSGNTALAFTTGLLKKVQKSGKRDLAELRNLKAKRTENPRAILHGHDIAYYGHELQKLRFNLDSEEVRAYFPLTRVLEGTFKIYGTLFGVRFEKIESVPLWHPDVELYCIKNPRGEILSYFALDLYPREGKYGHAAAFGVITGRTAAHHKSTSYFLTRFARKKIKSRTSANYIPPFATIVTNFSKPHVAKALAGKHSPAHPSLLSHGEVETFLHEFGHIMHFTLTTAHYASQSGYNTAWDFVEAPSQMLEHWGWDKKPLALLSAHYETGTPLPPALLKNLLTSKQHLLRYATLRQLILSLFDLTLHTKYKPPESAKFYRALVKKYTGIIMPKNSIFPAGFGHLDGYDAGYYGYMWSNVYAADMFTRFEKEGIMNKKTGAYYKKWILEKGGSEEALELVKGFLGRKPSNKAFLREIGVGKW